MKRLKMMTGVLVVICAAGVLAGCKNEGNTVNNAAGVTADITAVTAAGNTTGKATDDITNNTAGEAAGHTVALTLDMRGFYTGFTGLPGDYTMEEAAAAGYVVLHNSELAEGQEVWDKFMNSAVQGSNNGIRIANFLMMKRRALFIVICSFRIRSIICLIIPQSLRSKSPSPIC